MVEGMTETVVVSASFPIGKPQHEVHEGLNVVENWNATNDFLCYDRQGELATNSREQQEIVTLSLQLLQNCLMLINTVLVERTIEREGLWERLSTEDLRALTALFHGTSTLMDSLPSIWHARHSSKPPDGLSSALSSRYQKIRPIVTGRPAGFRGRLRGTSIACNRSEPFPTPLVQRDKLTF
jgi:hypothetical protein